MFNKKQISTLVLGVSLLGAVASNLANAAISQTPLFLGERPHPNIMFTLDNSGSMDFEYLPDSIGCVDTIYFINIKTYINVGECDGETRNVGDINLKRNRSAGVNKLFYDPNIRYIPWQKADGSYYAPSVPEAALVDPRAPNSATVNLIEPNDPNVKHCPKLSTFYRDERNRPVEVPPTCTSSELVTLQKFIAFYYDYTGNNPYDPSKFTRRQIDSSWVGSTKNPDRDDCRNTVCTYQEEQQNFANWFTFYRKRIFTAIAGISQAFNPLDGKQRVGYAKINVTGAGSNKVDGVSNRVVLNGVREFIGADRTAFYAKLFENVTPSGGTPLREAMDQVGKYFSRSDDKGPWAENPGVSKGTESVCRKSFHILMTDGYWNGTAASTTGTSDAETKAGPSILNPKTNTSYSYDPATAGSYYNSGYTDSLSNIAMYYWNHDLRPDLDNYVPVSSGNPAYWQHVVQYTVGLGLDGNFVSPGDEPGLRDGTKRWPQACCDYDNNNNPLGKIPAAVDDLWHAAVNGHGLYFSAKNPKAFRESLSGALADIASQTGAASSVALNFDQIGGSGNFAFVPSFESGSWVGHLEARAVSATGTISETASWKAEDVLPAPASRNIITYNPDTKAGIPFKYDSLTTTQKAAVSSDVLDYLRGSGAKEKSNNGPLRNRSKKLGDIVNSSPIYVHKLDNGYGSLNGYKAFVAGKATRTPMLYVGANDGMLHGFDVATGVETFAYVPNSVYPFLNSLSQTNYDHHYFVDGPLNESDAYDAGNTRWRTLLAGSTGAGARSVFMLDVTEPGTVASPGLSASSLLWELSGESGFDNDLGNVLSKIEVVRLPNGKWAAIFGNGYGSTNKKAVLYVVDAFTGAPISNIPSKIVLDSGNSADNGLSQPALLFNAQRQLVAVYAGDLQGNLWKVDFGSDGKGTKAFNGVPLFTTKDNATPAHAQPIIQRPALGFHPNGGYMVMFGTGKYFDVGDQANRDTQTAYGIWDKPSATAISNADGRNTALQQQTLTAQSGGASLTSITIDWAVKRGWFVDLNISSGARAVGNPYVADETTLYLTTLTPVSNSCDSGGKSALYAFDFISGGASHAFDTSNDTTRLSVIDIGATTTGSIAVRGTIQPPCTGPSCPTPPPCTGPSCACTGPNCAPPCLPRNVLVTPLDGGVPVLRPVNCQSKAPFRTWHTLNN